MKKLFISLLFLLSTNAFALNHVVTITGLNSTYLYDNRATIQGFLDQALAIPTDTWEFRFPTGRYYVDATIGVFPRTNSTLTLDKTELFAKPNNVGSSRVLRIQGVHHIIVNGSGNSWIRGERVEHQVTGGGEWGMGIEMLNSQYVTIKSIDVTNAFGDDLYVGTGMTNVLIKDVKADLARRQALTIISCITCTIQDSEFTNTVGVDHSTTVGSPNDGILYQGIGIDLEANVSSELIQNVTIKDCKIKGNHQSGIKAYSADPTWSNISNVVIQNNQLLDNVSAPFVISKAAEKPMGANLTTPSILFYVNTIRLPLQGTTGLVAAEFNNSKYVHFTYNTVLNNSRNSSGGEMPGIYAPTPSSGAYGNVFKGNTFVNTSIPSNPAAPVGFTMGTNMVDGVAQ